MKRKTAERLIVAYTAIVAVICPFCHTEVRGIPDYVLSMSCRQCGKEFIVIPTNDPIIRC
jgi:hypothetical protein